MGPSQYYFLQTSARRDCGHLAVPASTRNVSRTFGFPAITSATKKQILNIQLYKAQAKDDSKADRTQTVWHVR